MQGTYAYAYIYDGSHQRGSAIAFIQISRINVLQRIYLHKKKSNIAPL